MEAQGQGAGVDQRRLETAVGAEVAAEKAPDEDHVEIDECRRSEYCQARPGSEGSAPYATEEVVRCNEVPHQGAAGQQSRQQTEQMQQQALAEAAAAILVEADHRGEALGQVAQRCLRTGPAAPDAPQNEGRQ